MKKTTFLLTIFMSLFLFAPNLKAITGIVNDSDGINIRSSKTAVNDTNVLAQVTYNTQLNLVSTTKYYEGVGCNAGWYELTYNGKTAYACSAYISVSTSTGYVTGDYTAKVNTSSYISVKTSASYSSTTKDKLITGTSVKVISEHASGNGCDGKWLYVSYHDARKGYVCGSYINTKEELTLDENEYTEAEKTYAQNLIKAGFPESYIPYLMRMHRDHPTWSFVPKNNKITWDLLLYEEEWSNKIESTTTTALQYYIAPGATGTEGGNWYHTNTAVNAYFMDPRNFLSDPFIFTFEELSYNKTYHTSAVVKNIFGSSYLASDEYVGYFMEGAEKYNVSPLHLAARVIKEGGSSSTYKPILGTYTGTYNSCSLYGYYNYYNIGAYNSWSEGLYFAAGKNCDSEANNTYGRPWTSRKSAIIGGANFIADNYVKSGGETLYFQKFDTSKAPYFSKQYMTNIMAPTQEGENVYNTLKELNLLENNFVFIIPVYENMPETTSLPNIADVDASLSNIKINNQKLENFDSDVLEYTHYVLKDTKSVELSATTTKSTSTATYNETVTLTENQTTTEIKVIAQSGDELTYTIHIIKVDSVTSLDEIISKLSVKVTDDYMKNISNGTSASSLIQNIKKADPLATTVYKNSSGKVLANNTQLATGQTLKVTSSNGETKTYKIVVTGDNNGDGKITISDLLRVQKHLLGKSKLTDSYLQGSDTDNNNKVSITDLLRIQKHLLKKIEL